MFKNLFRITDKNKKKTLIIKKKSTVFTKLLYL